MPMDANPKKPTKPTDSTDSTNSAEPTPTPQETQPPSDGEALSLEAKLTKHYKDSRSERFQFIKDHIGFGTIVRTFRYDRGHPDGPELHSLTSTAIIIVQNAISEKVVTLLIARPQQIRRLYDTIRQRPPQKLLDLAQAHTEAGYNNR